MLSAHDRLTIFYALESEMYRGGLYSDERWVQLMEFRHGTGNLRSLVGEFGGVDYNFFREALTTCIYEICRATGKNELELQQEACP